MHARLLLLALAIMPSAVRADEDWRYSPSSAAEAVRVQANEIYPTLLTQLRLSYRHLDVGGSIAALTSETSVPMPFVVIPGVAFGGIYSIVHLDVPLATVKLPMTPRTTGIGDLQLIDAAIKYWDGIAVGGGFVLLIPAASHEVLGTGQLSLGPIAGASVNVGDLSVSIRVQNVTSIAGAESRDDINLMEARPSFIYYAPRATYVSVEPRLRFDWKAGGETELELIARGGFAINKHFVFVIEPSWIAVGPSKNDVRMSVFGSYVVW